MFLFPSIATCLGFISLLNSNPTFPTACQTSQSCHWKRIAQRLNSHFFLQKKLTSPRLGSWNHIWVVLPHSHTPSMQVPSTFLYKFSRIYPISLIKSFSASQKASHCLEEKNEVLNFRLSVIHCLFAAPSLSTQISSWPLDPYPHSQGESQVPAISDIHPSRIHFIISVMLFPLPCNYQSSPFSWTK